MLKWNTSESKFVAEQKENLQMEVMDLRQRCQNELHGLEQRLLANVCHDILKKSNNNFYVFRNIPYAENN